MSWTLCSERMPDPNVLVFLVLDGSRVTMGKLNPAGRCAAGMAWCVSGKMHAKDRVKVWMEVPPYKELV